MTTTAMMMMDVGFTPKASFQPWNFKPLNVRTAVREAAIRNFSDKESYFPTGLRCSAPSSYFGRRRRTRPLFCALVSEDVGLSSAQFPDFQVVSSSTKDSTVLKLSVEVSGTKTKAIFDDVFERMVEAAQPIPGFRRVKGGKTPNVCVVLQIPKDILMEILGASRVYKQVIEKVINCSVAEYVEKQGLKVSKDVKVEQCFEALEDAFNPGEKFNFEALLRIQAEPGN
ncbi:Trigger factor [Linum perenne]